MRFSATQAAKLARQINDRFSRKIDDATAGTPVPPFFVAGLIGVEAGKDPKTGEIKESSTRFERGVFTKLKAVRDGERKSWSGIKATQLRADSTDLALRALATSYGLCQVMGWHCINNLDCTIADLRDPEKHLGYAVQLMLLNAADGDFERKEYVGEFREWNSGSEKGTTYDPDYVYNAGAVMDAYREIDQPQPMPEPTSPIPVPDSKPVQAPVERANTDPPALQVPTPKGSISSKIAAGVTAITPILTATGLKIGGIQLSGIAILGLCAMASVGIICAAWLWDRDRQRQFERQRLSIQNLASPTLGNVVAKSE